MADLTAAQRWEERYYEGTPGTRKCGSCGLVYQLWFAGDVDQERCWMCQRFAWRRMLDIPYWRIRVALALWRAVVRLTAYAPETEGETHA
jgi:hypothetical protein